MGSLLVSSFCVFPRSAPLILRTLQANAAEHITAELQALYASFQRCMDLRDKYMTLSRQRELPLASQRRRSALTPPLAGLEDNPANYDGVYKPDGPPAQHPTFKPWEIYPPPPSPHWKERDPYSESTETTEEIAERERARRAFHWDRVVIPGREEKKEKKRYEIDSNGVYQVYAEGSSSAFARGRWENGANFSLTCREHRRARPQATLRRPHHQGVLPGSR